MSSSINSDKATKSSVSVKQLFHKAELVTSLDRNGFTSWPGWTGSMQTFQLSTMRKPIWMEPKLLTSCNSFSVWKRKTNNTVLPHRQGRFLGVPIILNVSKNDRLNKFKGHQIEKISIFLEGIIKGWQMKCDLGAPNLCFSLRPPNILRRLWIQCNVELR